MESFKSFLVTFMLPALILFFVATVGALVVGRAVYQYRNHRVRVARAKADIFLTELVFTPFDPVTYTTMIERFRKRIPFEEGWCKNIVVNQIIDLKRTLKGQVTQHIHFIYEQFDLFDYTRQFIESRVWYRKSIGLYHLQALDYEKGEALVRPLIASRNHRLASNAFIALITLNPQSVELLYRFRGRISLTNQIKILDVIQTKHIPMPSNLEHWLASPNPSVVRLGIRLMVHYNYNHAGPALLRLLDAKEADIRSGAISAIRELYMGDTESTLIGHFDEETHQNKIAIIRTLGVVGGDEAERFLTGLLNDTYGTDIRLQAMYSLRELSPDSFDMLPDDDTTRRMVCHVMDPNI